MAPSSALVVSWSLANIWTDGKNKIKVQLKLAISRLRMVQQRDSAVAKQQRRAMAQLLETGKDESARIRVENIIRSDITVELYEVLELYCELLLARTGLLEGKECDVGLVEAVQSLMYAAPRTEIRELQQVRQLFLDKYGKEFAQQAATNADDCVASRVLVKLAIEPPSEDLVTLYLTEIARTYGVAWPRSAQTEDAVSPAAETTDTVELQRATPPRNLGPRSPVSIAPPKPRLDNPSPVIKLPDAEHSQIAPGPKPEPNVAGPIPNADELAKRFAALKRT